MPTARAARRQGPLTALEGAEPAIAVGDVAVRHVRLTPDGLAPYLADARGGFVPWSAVRTLAVQPPSTWWPSPAIGDSIGPLLEGLLGGGFSDLEQTPSFAVGIVTTGDDRLEWRATQHYVSGYRRGDARAATRLAEYLVEHPEARVLLGRPAELLERISLLLRGRAKIAE